MPKPKYLKFKQFVAWPAKILWLKTTAAQLNPRDFGGMAEVHLGRWFSARWVFAHDTMNCLYFKYMGFGT